MVMTAHIKPSDIILPLKPKSPPVPTKSEWDKYRGNHHETIEEPGFSYGGGVSFAQHIGKPLSQELWTDLIFRLKVRKLLIYSIDDSMWTMGWWSGTAIITVDGKDIVKDIKYWR